jgi:hypothetical protein
MIKIWEWIGTGFGLAGSLALATVGPGLALVLFSISSFILVSTAFWNRQNSFIFLQAGFLLCNALGLYNRFW